MTKEVLIASRVPPDLVAELKKVEEAEHIDRSTTFPFLSDIRENSGLAGLSRKVLFVVKYIYMDS